MAGAGAGAGAARRGAPGGRRGRAPNRAPLGTPRAGPVRSRRVAGARPRPAGALPPGFEEAGRAWRKDGWARGLKPWREFWALRAAGAVVQQDLSSGEVRARAIEVLGLRLPADGKEWAGRLRGNALYRKNYLLIATGAAAAACAGTSFACGAAFLGCVAAAVLRNDDLLGGLALFLEERASAGGGAPSPPLAWNAERAGGLPRRAASNAILAAAGALLVGAAEVGLFLEALLGAVWFALLVTAAHASLRPVDMSSTVGNLVSDLRSSKSRGDVADALKSGWGAAKQAVDEAAKNAGDFTVFTSFTGDGSEAGGGGDGSGSGGSGGNGAPGGAPGGGGGAGGGGAPGDSTGRLPPPSGG